MRPQLEIDSYGNSQIWQDNRINDSLTVLQHFKLQVKVDFRSLWNLAKLPQEGSIMKQNLKKICQSNFSNPDM